MPLKHVYVGIYEYDLSEAKPAQIQYPDAWDYTTKGFVISPEGDLYVKGAQIAPHRPTILERLKERGY